MCVGVNVVVVQGGWGGTGMLLYTKEGSCLPPYLGLEVAVHDALLVQVRHRVHDLPHDLARLRLRVGALRAGHSFMVGWV